MEDKIKEEAIAKYASSKDLIIQPKALEILKNKPNFREIIDAIYKSGAVIVTKEELQKNDVNKFIPKAENFQANIKVLNEYTLSDSKKEHVKTFTQMFNNRLDVLGNIIKEKEQNLEEIENVLKKKNNSETNFVGIILNRKKTAKGNLLLDIEDKSGQISVLYSQENKGLFDTAKTAIVDDVVSIYGEKIKDTLVLGKDITWASIPSKEMTKPKNNVNVAVIGDLHVGSKSFCKKDFLDFIDWLNGDFSSDLDKKLIDNLKYLIVCGDLVDGVNIYYDQDDDLEINDIYKQYEELGNLLKKIPKHIEIILIPGDRDAVRKADPKPKLTIDFLEPLKDMKNIHTYSSPSLIEIEGLKFLLYHGEGITDYVKILPNLTFRQPEKAMQEALRRRSLSAGYGNTQLAPEEKDYMIIKEVPDVFISGHLHCNGHMLYKNTLLVNSGCFQELTKYRKLQGYRATPGVVSIIELDGLRVYEKRFIHAK